VEEKYRMNLNMKTVYGVVGVIVLRIVILLGRNVKRKNSIIGKEFTKEDSEDERNYVY
tara:strand:- start:631 stop:804 length:174 start_codon:yes stop_codon:yes gene_type:complete